MSVQEEPRSGSPDPAPAHEIVGLGLTLSAAGLYFMLGAGGVLPLPETDGPTFVIFCAGAAFLCAGIACVVRAKADMRIPQTGVAGHAAPAVKPVWRALGVGTAGALATIGTWVAIGPGPRAFAISGSWFNDMQTFGHTLGRTLFGLGAIIIWIYVIALTVGLVRKLLDRTGG